MRAILAAVKLSDNKNFDETLEECMNLCAAADIEVVDTIIQASRNLDPNTALRSGKLEEVANVCSELGIQQVVFYNNLPTKVVSNLKDIWQVDVMDRTSLILNIFSQRARSREARIQIEIARLKYDMPQLLKDNMDTDHQRGGTATNRGLGETRSTIIRRQMEGRINDLNRQLKRLETRKEQEYTKRSDASIKSVALVGYTNAGKSSLMNILLEKNEKSDKKVLEKDQLFATLDTSVRNIKYQKHEFLLYDTVGFVSDLPAELVEAFNSTLKAARYADLLVHVMDGSNSNYLMQKQVTMDTLAQIGANDIPIIHCYNKCDLIDEQTEGELYISCKEDIGIELLLDKIVEALYPKEESETLLIPYAKLAVIDKYQNIAQFTLIENQETGSLYRINTAKETLETIKELLKK